VRHVIASCLITAPLALQQQQNVIRAPPLLPEAASVASTAWVGQASVFPAALLVKRRRETVAACFLIMQMGVIVIRNWPQHPQVKVTWPR
jgi:hypothetical protein